MTETLDGRDHGWMTDNRAERHLTTGEYLPESLIDKRLRILGWQAALEDRFEVIWKSYEEQTGLSLLRPPTHEERARVLQWLRATEIHGDSPPMLTTARPMRSPALYQTVVEKASSIVQLCCAACEVLVNDDGKIPLSVSFAIDIDPWTAQSSKERVVIRESVTRKLEAKGHHKPTDLPICISIVSLLRRGTPPKDSDNLVKGLLDSLEGVLYHNDRQVQCLTARRLQYKGNRGAYFVMARGVRNAYDDVILDNGRPPRIVS